jgi:predicted Zn-dependent protease
VLYLPNWVETIHPLMTNAKRYKQFTVYVVESDDVDARSIPGGTLVFSTGLLQFARSEAALVGIVGHELSHLDREHLLLPLKRAKLLEKTKFVPNTPFDPRKFAESGTMMIRLMARPFRPEDESAADQDGAEWAYRAGYDSRELADLFARLHLKNQDQKVPFGSFFRTHPYNEDRSAAISAHFDKLRADKTMPSQLVIGKENLKKRVTKAEQTFAD